MQTSLTADCCSLLAASDLDGSAFEPPEPATCMYTQIPDQLPLITGYVRLQGQASLSAVHTRCMPVPILMQCRPSPHHDITSQLCTIWQGLCDGLLALQVVDGFPKAVQTLQAKARAELCGLQNCSKQSPAAAAAAAAPPALAGVEGAAGIAQASETRRQSSPAAAAQPRLLPEASAELAGQPARTPAQPLALAAAGGNAFPAAAAGRHAALPGSSGQAPPVLTAAAKASVPALQTGTAGGLPVAAAAGLESRRLLQRVARKASGKVSGQSAPQQRGPRGIWPASWRWPQMRRSGTMAASSRVRVMPPGSTGTSLPPRAQRATERKRATHGDSRAARRIPSAQRVKQSVAKVRESAGLGAGPVSSFDAAGAGPCVRTAAEAGSPAAGAGQADGSAAEAAPAGAAAAEVSWARGGAEAGHASRTAVPGANCAASSKGPHKAGSTGSVPAGQAGVGGSSSAVGACSAAVNPAAGKSDLVGPVHDRTECHQRVPGLISGCDSSELMSGECLTGSQSSWGTAGVQPAAPGSSKHTAAAVDAADAASQKHTAAAVDAADAAPQNHMAAAVDAAYAAPQNHMAAAVGAAYAAPQNHMAAAVDAAYAAPQKQAGAAELRLAPRATSPELAAVQNGAPQQQAAPAEPMCSSPAVAVQPAAVAVQTAAGLHEQASAAVPAADAKKQAAPAQLTELRCSSPAGAVQPAAVAVQATAGLHKQASAADHAADAAPQQQAAPAEPSGDRPAEPAKPLDAEVKASSKFGNRARAAAAWEALARSSKRLGMPAAPSTPKAGGAAPLQHGGRVHGELNCVRLPLHSPQTPPPVVSGRHGCSTAFCEDLWPDVLMSLLVSGDLCGRCISTQVAGVMPPLPCSLTCCRCHQDAALLFRCCRKHICRWH